MTTERIDATNFEVPADADPSRCPDCGRPFVREELLVLHRGYEHSDILDDAGTSAFEDTYESENDHLNVFRLKALLALILLYFVLLMTYAVV
ncbi:DUF7410 domain-containing protein [Halorhabdus amylolytica]|uniref:DUF7410 domain-containing protein n=1 Tax=Halorhabdus amylolytica TaxID=2559573 RepID=UPI0010AABB42|nr:C2H2-type zinc finger protein [Halorhabdus amylolytica]